jgi:hypothetical protein
VSKRRLGHIVSIKLVSLCNDLPTLYIRRYDLDARCQRKAILTGIAGSELYRFNTMTLVWKLLSGGDTPVPSQKHGFVYTASGMLYAFGGQEPGNDGGMPP